MPRTSEKRKVLTALEADLDRREETMKSMRLLSNITSFSGITACNDRDDDTEYYSGMNGIVQCRQLIIDSIWYKHNEIKNKQYLINRIYNNTRLVKFRRKLLCSRRLRI
jgi:hypothetical protein